MRVAPSPWLRVADLDVVSQRFAAEINQTDDADTDYANPKFMQRERHAITPISPIQSGANSRVSTSTQRLTFDE